jgi:hypothetical protein
MFLLISGIAVALTGEIRSIVVVGGISPSYSQWRFGSGDWQSGLI